MNYFYALAQALFKEDDKGNTLFYPWGVLGKGVVVDSLETKDKIIDFIIQYYIVTFIMIFLMQFVIIFMQMEFFDTAVIFTAMVLSLVLWYYQKITAVTHGLVVTTTKLTMSNGWESTAKNIPRFMIIAGLVVMVLLMGFSIIVFIYLEGMLSILSGAFLFVLGAFGTYAYYKMLQYAKKHIDDASKTQHEKQAFKDTQNAIESSGKNIAIVSIVVIATVFLVYSVYADSKNDFDERMALYDTMHTAQMATYLANANATPQDIDPITKHTGTKVENTTVYFYRELSSSMLSELFVNTDALEDEKHKMTRQLRHEMCGMPTWDLFYEKGGSVVYSYSQAAQGKDRFLFEIFIDKKFCM